MGRPAQQSVPGIITVHVPPCGARFQSIINRLRCAQAAVLVRNNRGVTNSPVSRVNTRGGQTGCNQGHLNQARLVKLLSGHR